MTPDPASKPKKGQPASGKERSASGTKRIAVSGARNNLADIVNRIAYGGERIIIRRRNKDVAAIIPVEDLALLQKLEDTLDIEAIREAIKESSERIPYEKARQELGLIG